MAVLTGEVHTAERRTLVSERVQSLAPDLRVVDDVIVTEQRITSDPTGAPEVVA